MPSNRRPAPRINRPHLFLVPDDAQPALWDSRELRRLGRLRQLAVNTGAPEEAIRLIEGAATADEALEVLAAAGLMPSEPDTVQGMVSWFAPLLEPAISLTPNSAAHSSSANSGAAALRTQT